MSLEAVTFQLSGLSLGGAPQAIQGAKAVGDLSGKAVTKAKGGLNITCEKVTVKESNAVLFKFKFGRVGETVADALPCFSLDIVEIVAGYVIVQKGSDMDRTMKLANLQIDPSKTLTVTRKVIEDLPQFQELSELSLRLLRGREYSLDADLINALLKLPKLKTLRFFESFDCSSHCKVKELQVEEMHFEGCDWSMGPFLWVNFPSTLKKMTFKDCTIETTQELTEGDCRDLLSDYSHLQEIFLNATRISKEAVR